MIWMCGNEGSRRVESDVSVAETDREAHVRARVGQGLFKQRVMQIETSAALRVTNLII